MIGHHASGDIDLTNQDCAPHSHCDCNDGKIDTSKVEARDLNVLPREDVPPKETGQRCAERRAECTIIDAKGHTVDRCPKGSLCDGYAGLYVYVDPSLNDTT